MTDPDPVTDVLANGAPLWKVEEDMDAKENQNKDPADPAEEAMDNIDRLLHQGNQRLISVDSCNVCEHCKSRKHRWGYVIETCHHPNLNEEADDGWPEVDSGLICDWFEG